MIFPGRGPDTAACRPDCQYFREAVLYQKVARSFSVAGFQPVERKLISGAVAL